MALASNPMRLDPELAASARSTAKQMSRSLSQQIAHWARIGRELERSPGITVAAVQAVLDGKGSYDTLNNQEQAIVLTGWAAETVFSHPSKVELIRQHGAPVTTEARKADSF